MTTFLGLPYRDRQDSIFNVLRMVVYGKSCTGAKQALDMADVDIDMVLNGFTKMFPHT